jgi:hypothetical protein
MRVSTPSNDLEIDDLPGLREDSSISYNHVTMLEEKEEAETMSKKKKKRIAFIAVGLALIATLAAVITLVQTAKAKTDVSSSPENIIPEKQLEDISAQLTNPPFASHEDISQYSNGSSSGYGIIVTVDDGAVDLSEGEKREEGDGDLSEGEKQEEGDGDNTTPVSESEPGADNGGGARGALSGDDYSICNLMKAWSYSNAKTAFPTLRQAIEAVESQGVVPWYTDNSPASSLDTLLNTLVSQCPESSHIALVVYGIPNKDCAAGFSNRGFNQNWQDYDKFINKLASKIGNRKIVYILEPDAVGLTANGECGIQNDYKKYLEHAITMLSNNPSADIFIDVGHWTLQQDPYSVAALLNAIWPENASRLKGLALNTANYQSTDAMVDLCEKFASVVGRDIRCVIDTSRNYRGPSGAWCNAIGTGLGYPPTANTGRYRAAYYLWIKPPGESDGECVGQGPDSMQGPTAGQFFSDHFKMLWNNGYFVQEQGASTV